MKKNLLFYKFFLLLFIFMQFTKANAQCSPGEILDCYGVCADETWLGDGYCDAGSYTNTNGEPVYFDCDQFGFDGGDCVAVIEGCTDPSANNYNASATVDNGTCQYCMSGEILDCFGVCANEAWIGDGICDNGVYTNGNGDLVYFDCDQFGNDGGDCNQVFGCTDPLATNFDPSATADNGTCVYCAAGEILDCNGVCASSAWVGDGYCDNGSYTNNNGEPVYFDCDQFGNDGGDCNQVFGCTDPLATNFDPSATADNGTCVYCAAGEILDCNGVCANSAWVGDGYCDDGAYTNNSGQPVYFDCDQFGNDGGDCFVIVLGCTDVTAFNYNPLANTDDGSCIPVVLGCTDVTAFNYNASANTDDGSCVPVVLGCTDASAFNYNAAANTDDGSCIEVIYGCTDPSALNYNPEANVDDASCMYGTNVADITALNNLQIYPNPTNDFLYVTTATTLRSVKLYNAQGQIQTSMNLEGNMASYKLNLNECSSGLYILEITLDNGSVQFSRVVKQ